MSKEDTEIDIVKDFLKMRGYKNALEGLEKDDYKTVEKKKVTKKIFNLIQETSEDKQPKLTKLMLENKERNKKYTKLQEAYKQLEKKHKGILQCARQIFQLL